MGNILITGCAGFIGFHLCKNFLKDGYTVIGIDNINDYYDIRLKQIRLDQLGAYDNFSFEKIDISDKHAIEDVFGNFKPYKVINLAAQAGVRYSIDNPHTYINSNVLGFLNVIESCRKNDVEHLIYASSSSVYGQNKKLPFSVHDRTDSPTSIYGVSKKCNELIASTYTHLYGLKTTGLRLFTVYGPWGRPDMAMYLFTENILNGFPINVFNNGKMKRSFSYIDDVVLSLRKIIENPPSSAILNVGSNTQVELIDLVRIIEENLNMKAIINFMPLQLGDVIETWADTDPPNEKNSFNYNTNIEIGVKKFIKWYKSFKGLA